jgi:hypothetical protein
MLAVHDNNMEVWKAGQLRRQNRLAAGLFQQVARATRLGLDVLSDTALRSRYSTSLTRVLN